jgi:NADH-quinone oxidoreductase subunit G
VIAHASALSGPLADHADVVFPAEAYAEKEGTIVHPDGRVQRLRVAIGRPGGVRGTGGRPGWQVIDAIAELVGHELGIHAGPMASRELFDSVPFYTGLTLDEIGGRGVRWPATAAAAGLEAPPWELVSLSVPLLTGTAGHGRLRLGTWRPLWAAPEVELSPALKFMEPHQVVELSPADAEQLGVREGDQVEVGANGLRVRGAARLRAAMPGGSVFLVAGTRDEPANLLTEPLVAVRRAGAEDGDA